MKNIILYQIHLYYIVLKNTTITHDCEMLEYWTEKTFPDGRTRQSKEFKVILVN